MRIALANDMLFSWGGGERVLQALHRIYPEAPIYTLAADKKFCRQYFPSATIVTPGLMRRWPASKILIKNRSLWPLTHLLVEEIEINGTEVVISATSMFMKGLVLASDTRHICYLHTPTRWAWQDYFYIQPRAWLERSSMRWRMFRIYSHFFRLWDQAAARRPDVILANSRYTASRVKQYYNVEAKVVYPPISTSNKKSRSRIKKRQDFSPKEDYFLMVTRLSSYKRLEVALEAFRRLGWHLVIVGEGKIRRGLEKAAPPNVHFTGFVAQEALAKLYSKAFGFIQTAEEDFGLACVEAMSFGVPVIAYGRGGAREYIEDEITGCFYHGEAFEQQVRGLVEAAERLVLNPSAYDSRSMKQKTDRFTQEKFSQQIKKAVANVCSD